MTLPSTTPQPGKIIFVGAGPGNPDLLTIRAREVMESNSIAVVDPDVLQGVRDVIASKLPVPQAKLKEANERYEQMCAEAREAGARRKPPRPADPTAAEIQEVGNPGAGIVEILKDGLERAGAAIERGEAGDGDVIRLVSGNPLTRDAVKEEISAVASAGLEFQVVPGMSLPSTVPSFAGIALGSTYTEADLSNEPVDWEGLAHAPQPLVLQAVAEQLPLISAELIERGFSPSTSLTVTTNGTTRLQRTFDATLETIGKIDADLEGNLVVTIGTAVDDRSKYSWWENRPLYGWRVLVPRAKEQAGPMNARLSTYGAIPQSVPTISMEPPRNPAQMDRAIKGIVEGRYQWIVFTSTNAVDAVWDKFEELGLDARSFAGVHLAAVGQKTGDALRARGMLPELIPHRTKQNAHGLVEIFPEYVEDIDPVSRVLLPRADLGTDVLVDGLVDLGWEVDDVVAYRTVRAAPPPLEVRDMIKSGGFDAVCFTSASTVKNLVGIAGKPHQRTIIAAIGPMAAAEAREQGLRVDVVPEVADVPSLVDALAEHVAGLRATGQLPPPRKKRRVRRKAAGE
ncbi:bifunctional uroporphyrinogen-III C-methyltransferase/uroporphyrinogen-III synthase [Corynebacterium sanguinis]|uniref:uroporphyrinogen-III synthase n=1 Tax=Corynebacterium sanguinis TaxID=2594913 RepID=UPI00223BCEC1|nr:bifunctional uroporphyrinogen-III C-methyltransferase/uroporphyrinogen-III synthase [Corynebacterium sanguinis]MCT1412014.1 bifunctional uroporphyrinogen-III C-methyltransferase/uroporphyrinogen-III synthase [Corynebacterium sanguinis]MCT1491821.1 bifunctional uroporphyrinogen-III C-methyltransferase/uroporphyrinogen-III synthase [Corynebacterium sanguinis]MCT1584614.1 bifunctional uroporphyrinogen-III C-methyltransferase/uroporphyrinogen-III synthase [Corynebacterium sanguinis]MCT2022607.1 